VEEAALLIAVHRVVGGVEVEDDAPGRTTVGAQKLVDEEGVDGVAVIDDFLVARGGAGVGGGELEAVEGALTGQGVAAIAGLASVGAQQIALADGDGQKRVIAKGVMIAQVLVAAHQSEDPLGNELLKRVLDQLGAAVVGETCGEALEQPRPHGDLAQQEDPTIRADPSGVEPADNLLTKVPVEFELTSLHSVGTVFFRRYSLA
jgi:hypothetical protein